jgi:ABC-type branched-subunit amino acid transport system ATPase component
MLLRVDGIDAGYGELQILHNLSIEVKEGETVCLIGPNGAGKSTVLRAVSGQIVPTQGRIFFQDKDVTGLDPGQKIEKGLIFVPQGQNVFSRLSIRENLEMSALFMSDRNVFDRRIEEVTDAFPWMRDKMEQPAGGLSGGLRQMLALARIILLTPNLVLLDEPSLGLAPLVVDDIFRLIARLNDQGIAFLLVEQNARKGLSAAHRGYVLEQGRNRLTGSGQELLQSSEVRKLYLGG